MTTRTPVKAHVFRCFTCGVDNDTCLGLAITEACCQRCATTAGATHSRQLVDGKWVALSNLPRTKT